MIELGALAFITSYKLRGASGFVKMMAPLPIGEDVEEPYRLYATTLAKMLDPHGSWNAPALSVVIGTEQEAVVTMAVYEPSQFVESTANVTLSLVLI